MFKKAVIISVIAFLSNVLYAYTVRTGHPRIYITPNNITKIRNNAVQYDSRLYNNIVKIGNGCITNPYIKDGESTKVSILAFLYQMNKAGMLASPGVDYNDNIALDYGKSAVSMALYNLENDFGFSATQYSCVFDWCYDIMSSTQMAMFAQKIIDLEGKDGEQDGGARGNEWSGKPATVYNGRAIIPGLAFYGENIPINVVFTGGSYTNASQAAKVYSDLFEDRYKNNVIPAWNMCASDDGGYGSGLSYGMDYLDGYLAIYEAWHTATGETSIYSNNNRLRYEPQYWMYSNKEYVGRIDNISSAVYKDIFGLVVEDCRKNDGYARLSRSVVANAMALIGNVYNTLGESNVAGLCEWMLRHKIYSIVDGTFPTTVTNRNGVMYLLWHDGSITPKSPTDINLPSTRIFGDVNETHTDTKLGVTRRAGTGWVIMRSKWDDVNGLQMAFRASPWLYHGHENWKEGTFYIGYKGELALLDSGNYEDGGQDGTYYERTIAANSMIVYNPEQIYQGWNSNDGGQCHTYQGSGSAYDEILPGTRWERPGITKFETSINYDYMSADLAKNYNIEEDGRNINKLSYYTRGFIWLKSNNLNQAGEGNFAIVVDKIGSTNASWEKRWLLHTINRPVVNGTETTMAGNSEGGVYKSENSDIVKTAGWKFGATSSQLYCKTISPSSHSTVIVGGTDYEFTGADYVNHPLEKSGYNEQLGKYRIEIEPKNPQKDDYFLHVLYPCDNTITVMPDTNKIVSGSGNMSGVYIKATNNSPNWVVMLTTTAGTVNNVSYQTSGSGAIKNIICDLVPDRVYEIRKDASVIGSQKASKYGTLYFESTIGGLNTFNVSAVASYYINGIVKDSSNKAVSGVNVAISGDWPDSMITGTNGLYNFWYPRNLGLTVKPTKKAYVFSPSNRTTTSLAGNIDNWDFICSRDPNICEVKGYVKDVNGDGISSVTLTLSGSPSDTVITEDDGAFSFFCTRNSNYVISVSKAGYSFSPSSCSILSINGDIDNVIFIGTVGVKNYTISGYVKDNNGNGIESASICITGDVSSSIMTRDNGYYTFLSCPQSGNVQVVAAKNGYTFTPSNYNLTSVLTNIDDINFTGIGVSSEKFMEKLRTGDLLIIGSTEGRGTINPQRGDKANIYFEGTARGIFVCKIFTLTGELVWQDSKESEPVGLFEWIPKNIASGTYIVHVSGPGIKKIKKLSVL